MSVVLYGFWSARYGGSTPATLSVFLGGLDCGDYTVAADGSVTVPYKSDPDGILTAAYLQSISSSTAYGALTTALDVTIGGGSVRVYVPCVVGYNYTSEGETVRPATADQIQSPQGPGLGKTRRVHMFSMLLQGTIGGGGGAGAIGKGLQVRSGPTTTWYPAQLTAADRSTLLNYETMFNGVHQDVIDGDSNFDGVVSWQMTRPYPVTVCAINTFLETSER